MTVIGPFGRLLVPPALLPILEAVAIAVAVRIADRILDDTITPRRPRAG